MDRRVPLALEAPGAAPFLRRDPGFLGTTPLRLAGLCERRPARPGGARGCGGVGAGARGLCEQGRERGCVCVRAQERGEVFE